MHETQRFFSRRTPLKKKSASSVATVKADIQALLRSIVIVRDGGCILRGIRHCGGLPGQAVLQADHLITRANSASYAEPRLIVCVCRPCHAWKSLGNNMRKAEYDALVKTVLPPDRVALWEAMEADKRPHRYTLSDWLKEAAYLRTKLAAMKS